MNLFVLCKLAPDTVEELNVAAGDKSLDAEWLRYKLSDPDEHALEQALLLKEKCGGTVTVVALDAPELDDALFTALAKGADRAVKFEGDFSLTQSGAAASIFAEFLAPGGQALPPDTLSLLRSQAIDDLEGEIGPFLAERLGVPYAGVVTRVTVQGAKVQVAKEFAGGTRGEFTLPLPAVLGIQSAERPPRYVPIAKVRAVMKSAKIQTVEPAGGELSPQVRVEKLYKPEAGHGARMLEGSPEEVAGQLVEILAKQSLI